MLTEAQIKLQILTIVKDLSYTNNPNLRDADKNDIVEYANTLYKWVIKDIK